MDWSENARKDLIPPAILLVLCVIFHFKFFAFGSLTIARVFSLLPFIFFVLYIFNVIKPRGLYVPKRAPKNSSFSESMYGYVHPVLMPSFIYIVLGIMYFILSVVTFLIAPVSRYFYNWSQIMFGMGSGGLEPVGSLKKPPIPGVNRKPPIPKVSPKAAKASVPHPDTSAPASSSSSSFMGNLRNRAETRKEADRQTSMQREIERTTIRSMEQSLSELYEIRENSAQLLDSIFGNSRISKARFMTGLDSAVEMAEKNLNSAREYVKVGHNPEILKKYYSRSMRIKQAATDLFDSLAEHEQNAIDDDFRKMSDSLDELQESVKYYE